MWYLQGSKVWGNVILSLEGFKTDVEDVGCEDIALGDPLFQGDILFYVSMQ